MTLGSRKVTALQGRENNMTQDRNYLRMLSNRELINMGRERDNGDDLVLVLAERLSDLAHFKAHLEAAQAEIDDLEAEIAILKAK